MTGERTLCPHCGRLTLKGTYCMFCGGELREGETPEPQEEKIPETAAPTEAQPAEPSPVPEVEMKTLEVPEEVLEEEPDIQRLVDQVARMNSWRLKLIDMLLSRETRADVFAELYMEYLSRMGKLNEKRIEELRKTEERVATLTMELEQLKLRHEVGEIADKQYITSKLEIDRELSRQKPKLMVLQNPFKVRPADLTEFNASLVEKIERFEKEASSLGVDKQMTSKAVKDLNEMLEVTKALLEEQKKIRKQIEKLEVKFRIGELREEDYTTQKQKLQRELGQE